MTTEWFASRDGSQEGPFSSSDLKAMALSGELLASNLIWKEGLAEWVSASSVKGLFPTPPPVPDPSNKSEDDIFADLPEIRPSSHSAFAIPAKSGFNARQIETEVICYNCNAINAFDATNDVSYGDCHTCGSSLMVPNLQGAKYNNKKKKNQDIANMFVGCLLVSIFGVGVLVVAAIFVLNSIDPSSEPMSRAYNTAREKSGSMAEYIDYKTVVVSHEGDKWFIKVYRSAKPSLEEKLGRTVYSDDESYIVLPDGTCKSATENDWEIEKALP